jgi:propionyl-CoA carboxylase alpha chain
MRVVESEADFESQMDRAIMKNCQLLGWFCFLSKNIWVHQHIEIQVMADSHGNVLYLFENVASSVVTKSD